MSDEDRARRVLPPRIGIGKMFSDIAESCCTEKRITESMKDHIAVAVGDGTEGRFDGNPTQNEGFSGR
jgi:hypothetical protein